MENCVAIIKPRVLYAFIDKETADKYEKHPRAAEPTLMLKHDAMSKMLDYALDKYFGLNSNGKAIGRLDGGGGFYDGVYFSISTVSRAVCVAVSTQKIGVDIVTPHDDDTVRSQCKLQALKKKHNLLFDHSKNIDDFESQDYAYHEDEFLNRLYVFAVTDAAEFIKTDIKTFLP